MPLSDSLRFVFLTVECPVCNHPLVKKGGWFRTVGRFKCAGCRNEIRLSYRDKIALFEKHAGVTPSAQPPTTGIVG